MKKTPNKTCALVSSTELTFSIIGVKWTNCTKKTSGLYELTKENALNKYLDNLGSTGYLTLLSACFWSLTKEANELVLKIGTLDCGKDNWL